MKMLTAVPPLLNKSYIWLEMAGGITLVAHELLIGHKALCLLCLLLPISLARFGYDFQTYIWRLGFGQKDCP